MPGTILENLSGRKLGILVFILLLCQLACFLVGLIAPKPATSQPLLAITCLDTARNASDINHWLTPKCKKVNLDHIQPGDGITAGQIVFVVEMPLFGFDFSRWQQNLVGVLQLDLVYHNGLSPLEFIAELTIDSRLAYSDQTNVGRTPWKYHAHAEEKRYMDCSLNADAVKDPDGYTYNCSMVPLFELGSLYHDYYLLNMRLPRDEPLRKNTDLQRIQDIYLHMIHMNGGYTRIWVSLKTVFFPIIVGIMAWFWRRVYMLARTPALLECMLMTLGGALALLDLPVEYLTLIFDMPYMLLLSDIRQGVFYAALLSFWLVFAGEHMLIQDNGEKNSIRLYWKHLSTIVVGCLSLLVFDFCERGIQLVNPFYSIWVTPIGTNLALSFIILAGISASMYFIFLCYMIWRVFKNISIKRAVLPNMSQVRRLHYEGIIYRFNFLMLATVICAAVTVVSFILNQVAEGDNKWDENMDLELSSALHTGIYGMWNVYICAMLMLYAPSHKQWPTEPTCVDGEEVEFSRLPTDPSPTEISSLTSFASKASIE